MARTFWNYRVVKTTSELGPEYAIHEVYYANDVPDSWTEDLIAPYGETLAELRRDLAHMAQALDKPVLEVVDGKLKEARDADQIEKEGQG